LREGLAILEARLKKLVRVKSVSKEELASTDWDRVDGYRRRPHGQDQYFIKREAFNALFATRTQKDLVLKYLIENGQIALAVAKGGGAALAVRKPQDQFIWPDGQRRRSYEIVMPRN
jgi:hypothetical protein